MEHDLVVEGRAVTSRGLEELQFGVDAGKIVRAKRQGLRGARKISAEGCLIFPGFIDVHAHLREPGWEYKEDFATGTAAAVHGGVTTVFDMPNNPVPATDLKSILRKEQLSKKRAHVDVKFLGGVTDRSLRDISAMKRHVVAYKIYLAKSTGGMLLSTRLLTGALEKIAETGRPASVHCEDQSEIEEIARRGGNRAASHGVLRPPRTETDSVRRVLAAQTEGPVNICHLSTGESVGLVSAARKRHQRVGAEATLHHLYFSASDLMKDRMLRTNPPLRTEKDREALFRGLEDGSVDFLVTDHAPHTEDDKMEGNASGVPGLDNYANLVTWLMERGLDPAVVLGITSRNQARFFGLEDRGALEPGMRADFTILDTKAEETVTRDSVRSKCGWSPYEGRSFPGRARWTISAGRVLMDDFELAL